MLKVLKCKVNLWPPENTEILKENVFKWILKTCIIIYSFNYGWNLMKSTK